MATEPSAVDGGASEPARLPPASGPQPERPPINITTNVSLTVPMQGIIDGEVGPLLVELLRRQLAPMIMEVVDDTMDERERAAYS